MLRDWINEARPKTLLLGLTNCGLGCALGLYYGAVNCYTMLTSVLIVITGVMLQILCNFANDYGDAYKAADTDKRLGPIRAVMSGEISLSQLRKGMAMVTVLSAFFGLCAVGLAVGNNLQLLSWFIFLGIISILAALFYTLGMAYGYKGLGDISVFMFFGLLAVLGSQVLVTAASDNGLDVYPDTILLGVSLGCASVMLLHVSSLRDILEDIENGKRTLASRMGYRLSAIYLGALFIATAASSLAACVLSHKLWEASIIALSLLPLMASAFRTIRHVREGEKVALERKYTALGITIHNVAWMIVLILDFWVYY